MLSVMFFPTDPNNILPIGSVLGGAMVLFFISVIICYMFKIDIVLWLRRAFPVLYTNKGNIAMQVCNNNVLFITYRHYIIMMC